MAPDMTRRSKIWLVVASLFTVANVGGAVFAAVQGELLHAAAHVVLVPVGAFLVWRLAHSRRIWGGGSALAVAGGEITDSLTHLQQSVDAVAVEVERIGEGQRFITRVFTEKGIPRPPADRAPEPAETKAP